MRYLGITLLTLLLIQPCFGKPGRGRTSDQAEAPTPTWPLEQSRTYERADFCFSLPDTWRVNRQIPTHKPDHHITIEATGNSFVQLELFTARADESTQDILNSVLEALDGQLIISDSSKKMNEWGAHRGAGRHLRGDVLGRSGGVRIFATRHEGTALLVMEVYYYAGNADRTVSGFNLIADTFDFKSQG